MAFPPTLLSLRNQAKNRCDMAGGSTFVSDAEWNEYLSECGSELYDIILKSDETALVKTVSIPTVSSQSLYQLPQDFYKINAVFERTSATRLLPMSRMSAHDLGYDDELPYLFNRTTRGSRYRYYMENLALEIRPIPTGVFTMVFKYVPQFTKFEDDASIAGWPTVNGWEEYLVVGSAIKGLLKEGSTGHAGALMAERERLAKRILSMSSGKDQFSARQIRDVYGTTQGLRRSYLPNR